MVSVSFDRYMKPTKTPAPTRLQHADRRALDATALTSARVSSGPCRFCGSTFDVTVEPGLQSRSKSSGNPAPNRKTKTQRRGATMRFMMLVKHAEKYSGPPPKELMDAMAKLSEEAVKAGTMIASGGLAPPAASTRGRAFGGAGTGIGGPFPRA